MTYPAYSFNELTNISGHSFASLRQDKVTGKKSLLSTTAVKAGAILATFEAEDILAKANKYTLQVNENTHIILRPDVLQFVNHSCNPNVFFDTTTFELRALLDIIAGDEFTFFYPSTEWQMESPFNCLCGYTECLHVIQGASFLSPETIARYRFTDFISQKFKIPHLQKA